MITVEQGWNTVVFSNESCFCLGVHYSQRRKKRRRCERYDQQFAVERHVQHIVGVLVPGAIAMAVVHL